VCATLILDMERGQGFSISKRLKGPTWIRPLPQPHLRVNQRIIRGGREERWPKAEVPLWPLDRRFVGLLYATRALNVCADVLSGMRRFVGRLLGSRLPQQRLFIKGWIRHDSRWPLYPVRPRFHSLVIRGEQRFGQGYNSEWVALGAPSRKRLGRRVEMSRLRARPSVRTSAASLPRAGECITP
jgi:hypothetical protein